MAKNFTGYIILLVLGMASAFYASLPTADKGELGQEWFSLNPKDIAKISFEDESVKVLIEPRPFGYWVDVEEEKKAKDGETKTDKESFKASSDMKEVEDNLHPFVAQRVVEGENLNEEEFGLKDAKSRLTVEGNGKKLELLIGKRSYGSRDVYARDLSNNKVILVTGSFIDLLKNARSRLIERDVVRVADEKVKKVEIAFGDKKTRWDHTSKDQHGQLQWKEDKEGAKPQSSYRNWIDKIYKNKVMSYINDVDMSKVKDASVFLTVSFLGDNGKLDEVRFKKSPAADNPQNFEYWAESDSLQVPVKVSPGRMTPIEKDLSELLGGR